LTNEILNKLNKLSESKSFRQTLIRICFNDLYHFADELGSIDIKQLLNLNEIAYLFGLELKNRNIQDDESIEKELKIQEAELRSLMKQLHHSFLSAKMNLKPGISFKDLMLTSNSIVESTFYASDGAYDLQYISFLEQKYSYDEKWIKEKKGFNFKNARLFFQCLRAIGNFKINFKYNQNLTTEIIKYSKQNFVFTKYPQFLKIIEAFSTDSMSIGNKNFEEPNDFNEFRSKPIIEFNDHYLIPLPYLIAESLFESPFYWFLEDNEYKSKALHNRGTASEDIVVSLFSKVFNPDQITKNILVKPNRTKTLTEFDVCIFHKGTLYVFQVKSKRLTKLAKNGNTKQLENDFRKAVVEAHKQTTIAYKPIKEGTVKLVDEDSNNVLQCELIKEIKSIVVLTENYPAVKAHSNWFYYDEQDVLLTISIFHLQIILLYLRTAERVSDYLNKRIKYSKMFVAETELAFLQYYLDNDINPKEGSDIVMIYDDYAQQFDEHFYIPLSLHNDKMLSSFVSGIKRNDFCFCGSGKKYKKCCLDLWKNGPKKDDL
jgi:hypothetical protein